MLRDYQQKGVDEIQAVWATGEKRVLLKLATGGGKTVIFSHTLVKTAARGYPAMMVVRGRELVNQASQRLFREGAHHGVYMAGHWNYRPGAKIQVCSIDTLHARKQFPPAKLIVFDEAQDCTSERYHEFMKHYPNAYTLAVTATPYGKNLRHIANKVINPIGIKDLMSRGYLVDSRYFSPFIPDLSQVKTDNGEWNQSQLAEVMSQSALVGDVVTEWKKRAGGRPSLCFAVTVEHSKKLAAEFCAAGVPAEHCDADTPEGERKKIMARHASGETKVISNVGIFCVGVDMPWLQCVIMARPLKKSYNLYVQQWGRGTRPFPGKTDFMLLDHAGNVMRHGFPTDEPKYTDASLDGKGKKTDIVMQPKTCDNCFFVHYAVICPDCKYAPPAPETRDRDPMTVSGELKELGAMTLDERIQFDLVTLKKQKKDNGYHHDWIHFQLRNKYGAEIAEQHCPRRKKPWWLKSGS